MNELTIIDQRELLNKDFKIYGTIDNPLFLAKNVAEWIEHSKASIMLDGIDDDRKLVEGYVAIVKELSTKYGAA